MKMKKKIRGAGSEKTSSKAKRNVLHPKKGAGLIPAVGKRVGGQKGIPGTTKKHNKAISDKNASASNVIAGMGRGNHPWLCRVLGTNKIDKWDTFHYMFRFENT